MIIWNDILALFFFLSSTYSELMDSLSKLQCDALIQFESFLNELHAI